MFVLIFTYQDGSPNEYYGGGSYRIRGEKYAVVTGSKDKAKRFKSRKIAENAFNKMFESCANVTGGFRIEEAE